MLESINANFLTYSQTRRTGLHTGLPAFISPGWLIPPGLLEGSQVQARYLPATKPSLAPQ